jgi:hypothetical protein
VKEHSSEVSLLHATAVSYTDFMWAANLLFFKRLGNEVYQEVLRITGDPDAHIRFMDALSPWTERDD